MARFNRRRLFGFLASAVVAAPAAALAHSKAFAVPCRECEQFERRRAEFIEKLVRPPMMGSPVLKNEPASIMPGMITFVSISGSKRFAPAFEVYPWQIQHMTNTRKCRTCGRMRA